MPVHHEVLIPLFFISCMKRCMFGAHLRLRTQTHSGSDYEISQKLKEFGLDEVHCLPFIRGAIYNQEQCAEFLKEQRKKEKTRRDGT